MKKIIPRVYENKPGHYSPGIVHDGLLYVSGQLSIDPETGQRPKGGIKAEAQQALNNLNMVLEKAGTHKDNVIQCRVYIPDVKYWKSFNEVYAVFFGEHKPARAVVPTNELHFGCLVEIEAIAVVDQE